MHLIPLLTAVALLARPGGEGATAGAAAPLSASPAASLSLPAGSPLPLEPAAALPSPSARLPLLGLMLTAGVPDGGVVSLVVRPWQWLRVDGGLAYNALSFGAQGGVTFVPFHWGLVPTLRVEGGRYFQSDVNAKVSRWAGDVPTYLRPALDGFGYDYASAQLGFEMGSQGRFIFFVRGGLAWVRGEFGDGRNLQDEDSPGTEMDVKGLRVTATGPTASLGFLFYVW